MNMVSMAFLAAGLFLAAYAVRLLFLSPAGRRHSARPLGCGFMILAGVVWGIALGIFLENRAAGFRLALGFALLLPALAALVRPERRSVAVAVTLLVLAVLIAGPAVPLLRQRLKPSESMASALELKTAVAELDERNEATAKFLEKLTFDRTRVKREIRDLGHQTFDELAADRKGYALLRELHDIDRLLAATESQLTTFHHAHERMSAGLRRVERLAASESATGVAVTAAELSRVLTEIRALSVESGTTATVEEHVERQALQDLFEREF